MNQSTQIESRVMFFHATRDDEFWFSPFHLSHLSEEFLSSDEVSIIDDDDDVVKTPWWPRQKRSIYVTTLSHMLLREDWQHSHQRPYHHPP